jgi:hypothetical protein
VSIQRREFHNQVSSCSFSRRTKLQEIGFAKVQVNRKCIFRGITRHTRSILLYYCDTLLNLRFGRLAVLDLK